MKHPKVGIGAMGLVCGLFAQVANATPIYNLTAGSLSYTNNYLGSSEGNSFSFTGPQPVSVQGGGGNNSGYNTLEQLGTPFNITLGLIIDDTGNEAGTASANGISYGLSEYIASGTAQLMNSTPITLSAGHLTVSVAATVSGQLNVCTPDQYCAGGNTPNPSLATNPFDVSFGPLAGTLTVTYTELNQGPNYSLVSAQFVTPTAAPEPATLLIAGIGILAMVGLLRRARKIS